MVPLVFKTSLGAVRLPEGSTPSLLRQTFADRAAYHINKRNLIRKKKREGRNLPYFRLLTLLKAALAEHCEAVDFLRDNEAYKYFWGAKDQPTYRRVFLRDNSPDQREVTHLKRKRI